MERFIRAATTADVDALVRLVNEAYTVERFFVLGDRVTPDAVIRTLAQGVVFVVDALEGSLDGCVFVSVQGGRGYFGMLAVAPSAQGQGLGRRLIDRAETYARDAGATMMDISVVNVRTDLIATYARMGFVPRGTEPYEHRPVLQPVHFVLMEKSLS